MDMKDSISAKLRSAFAPERLEVIDESASHAGHAGWRAGETTHVRVRITSRAFAGMSRVAIHRAVNAALAAELAGGLHALAIEARTP